MTTKNTNLICSTCGYKYEEAFAIQLEEKIKSKFEKQSLAKENEIKDREKKISSMLKALSDREAKLDQQVTDQVNAAKATIYKELERQVTGKVKKAYDEQIQIVNKELEATRKENIGLKKLGLENDKLKNDLDLQRIRIETEFEKKKSEDTKVLTQILSEKYQQEYELKIKDRDRKLEILKEQITIMKTKSEQGSQQAQGETLENYVVEILNKAYPSDRIEEIKKGQHGADVLQVVINQSGNDCGKILWECKRTKSFKAEWIDKLKSDALEAKADLKVLVTEVLPDKNEKISIADGICICKYQDVKGVSALLRIGLLQVASITSSHTNKGEKMQMLYNYLMSDECKMLFATLVEEFIRLEKSYLQEKRKMTALYNSRQKQLEKIILNLMSFYGTIKGIAGANALKIDSLESPKLMLELNAIRQPKRKAKRKAMGIKKSKSTK